MSRIAFILSRLKRRIWLIPGIFTLMAILVAPIAGIVGHLLPRPDETRISEETLILIMQVLAGSMLPVATFSVAAMISAFHTISANATPRATDLAIADTGSQVALGTFVGTFLFSVSALIGLNSGFYGPNGYLILFVLLVGVILFVAATIVRWIDHVSKLGLMSTTIALLERSTANAFDAYMRLPRRPLAGGSEPTGLPVVADRAGYVQQIDVEELTDIARNLDATIHVLHAPGDRIAAGTCIARVEGCESLADDCVPAICSAFTIADSRTFENDPRFGLSVLSEIAERTLSPAVNDPGTARAIVDAGQRLIAGWVDKYGRENVSVSKGVTVPALQPERVLDAAFSAIARDGADKIEIALDLQDAYRQLAARGDAAFAEACAAQSGIAYERAVAALTLDRDRAVLTSARMGAPAI